MNLETKKIIMDVDTGIDDAIAILYALKSPKISIEGITTVFGNIGVEQATENTLRVIQLANPTYEIPVAMGADKPLKRELSAFSNVHGHNGIGDVELPTASQEPVKEKAADFILRKSHEFDGDLSIITLGRLTNLAHALLQDPTLADRIKQVYVMGGAVQSPGNVTPVAEANIWGDPEAADIVFTSGIAVTMVGLDVTMKTNITRQHLEDLKKHSQAENQEIVSFIEDSLSFYFDFYRASNYFIDAAPMHDPLTVLVAIDPSLVKTQQMLVKVECESELCLGMTVADRRANPVIGTPIQVCVDVEAELAVQKMLAIF